MPKNSTNIYQAARLGAGLTQEQAAELLALGVRTLADYEIGQRRPPAQTVDRMARLYGSPGLRLDHARESDELGIIPPGAVPRPIEQAALAMALQWRSLEPHVRRFMEIARDGRVDESEEIDLEAVQASVADFVATLLSVRCAKKERPDGGTSKRSSSQRTENHCTSIVSGFSGDCKSFFAGTEVSAK